ncbi:MULTISPECIES: hypothetical protein [unclassified Massilia]|uniref:hypothetical protein n=1 Tax=unclassified Massilia TaxID=2609279 RepID=UPI0017846748|nr:MULTISPECIES: hypothetical protein [unclassified Massilia]MBD8531145.1 hypothetical protein [Massilia sp. CFBP 13647]MBD8674981.1 hypothetical protein [Massilia sp. CFBP 13721]
MKIISHHYKLLTEILRLPVAELHFHEALDPADIRATYRYYTKPHPRYKLIRNKTVGAALLDLNAVPNEQQYLELIKGKNAGAHHAKRARNRGYQLRHIDRNAHIDDIYAINTSLEERQGRPMDTKYREKPSHFETLKHFRYYGVFNPEGRMVAYANLGHYGNFASFSQLIGIRNNDGIMHMMVVDIVSELLGEQRVRYLMYDTFFGAQPGLQTFKKILGFRPYRAKYALQ